MFLILGVHLESLFLFIGRRFVETASEASLVEGAR
jgi:hypothetical protein